MENSTAMPVIIALDVKTLKEVEGLISLLAPFGVIFKIGLELISSVGGPQAIKFVQSLGGRIFYGGKFKDIPNTVAEASRAVAALGVDMLNVHIDSGSRALEQTAAAVKAENPNTKVLGVTVLTSEDFNDLVEIGYPYLDPADPSLYQAAEKNYIGHLVYNMADLAAGYGLDGVICSPRELPIVARWHHENPVQRQLLKVTPGVRRTWAAGDEQARFTAPRGAAAVGADYLVIGRPITKPPKEVGGPVEALKLVLDELSQ